jgi:arylsulfatase A-like enzyme
MRQPARPGARVTAALLLSLLPTALRSHASEQNHRPPNIVLIVADDLGYGHLGCYGQTKIRTPNLDRLAAEGMRFTQFYAGACVCAPSRSVLMTGLHTGHTPVRRNGGGNPLRDADVTLAEVLRRAPTPYATGGFGKWGLGTEDSPGAPTRQGFNEFFGYLHQVHAHFYYPYWLSDNGRQFMLPENESGQRGRYAHDVILDRGLDFIRRNSKDKVRPFFCYLPVTLPHVELVVPEDSLRPYRGQFPEKPLPDPRPGYIGADEPYATFAGIVTRLDDGVGRVTDLLDELGLAENTLILFTSDNGPQAGAWADLVEFFDGNGPFRAEKGTLYEGGLRVPLIARWEGRIEPGVSDRVCGFQDLLPTLAEAAGAELPANVDGISFLPTLLGEKGQKGHEFLYWEHFTGGNGDKFIRALRAGDWKIVQPKRDASFELYDLSADPGEMADVAAKHPDVVARLRGLADAAHTPARDDRPESRGPTVKDYVR